MDVASHGLWGGVVFGRKNRRNFWAAFSFGVAPDMLSFGIFFFQRLFADGFVFRAGPPALELIPLYVAHLYSFTHSFVVFAAAFGLAWFFMKKPFWPMAAWGFHIILDVFTHDIMFFPTPVLWPVSDFRFDGVPWSHPAIWFTNLALLAAFYILFWREKRVSPRNLQNES